MSYADITSRVAQIQARIAQLQGASTAYPTQGSYASSLSTTGSTDFASVLGGITSSGFDSMTPSTPDASGGEDGGQAMASFAATFTGTPYVAGGESPQTGWDCARFTQWVAKQFGINLPAVSWEQINTGQQVDSLAQAQAGDLLFFHEPGGHRRDPSALKVNHVAVYLGDGRMVEAANPSAGTIISQVDAAHLVGIRRIAATTTTQ
ncbi:MAG: C40 family peptidase [Candidatus Nanopelagicales bacterium]